MKADFVLSEKIGGKVLPNDIGDLSVKDVKEFIRLLKRYFTTKQSRDFINKLAGEELI